MDELNQANGFEVGADFIKVRIASVTAGYNMTFKADGNGIIAYTEYEYTEKFTHKLNIAEAQAKYPDARELEKYVTRYFWKEVNPTLRDPFLHFYDDLDMHELEFTTGNRAEFDRIMRLFILTEPNPEASVEGTAIVEAAAPAVRGVYWDNLEGKKIEDGKLEPQLAEWCYYSERLDELVDLLVEEHRPYGFTYEYNDQAYDRKSGYSLSPTQLEYKVREIVKAPAREKMAARAELRKWLEERGENPAEFDLDDWEKVL